nr:ABC transporter ATP-binding protein [uncultured Niameybacter sp.]
MKNNIAIQLRDISKIYRLYEKPIDRMKEALNIGKNIYHKEFYALNGITFDIEKGASVGIIGKNGCGKSTLLKIITGVVNPSKGSVNVNGKISALLELGTGFNPEYTGIENIYLNGSMLGYSKEEMDSRVHEIVSFADIGDFVYQPVKTYSSGMFVRLAFAVAINVDPDILIVDEALAVGDSQFQLKCINKIKMFINSGKTVFFVTHDGYTIKNLCQTAIWINEGKIEMMGNSEAVVNEYERFMEKEKEEPVQVSNIDNDILQITDAKFKQNGAYSLENKISNNQDLIIEVHYNLFSEVEKLVAGIAIYKFDGTYVCGLNTKLDNFEFKSVVGKNIIQISYTNISLLPGSYFIDIGFFEPSGVGRFDYKRKFREFIITAEEYRAEGIINLPHEWKSENK